MFKLLLVDDERPVVEGLKEIIPWEELKVDQVYIAVSAQNALHVMNQHAIDIVVTDIQMPGISGIELIKEIERRWPRTKIILLSGHAEFEYAKQAIKQNVIDYLLKPIRDNTLIDAVNRAQELLRQEWEQIGSYERSIQALRENLPLLRENLLNELLQGGKIRKEEWERKREMLDIPFFPEDECSLMLVRMDELGRLGEDHPALAEFAIGNIAAEALSGSFHTWKCKVNHGFLIFVMKLKSVRAEEMVQEDEEEWIQVRKRLLEEAASQFQNMVSHYLKSKVSILISNWGVFPGDLKLLYQQALSSLIKYVGDSEDFLHALMETKPHVAALRSLHEHPTVAHLLEVSNWKRVYDKVGEIFSELNRIDVRHREFLMEVYFSVSSAVAMTAHNNGYLLSEVLGDDDYAALMQPSYDSVRALELLTYRVLNKMEARMTGDLQGNRLSIVQKVHSFIEKHLDSDVSLQSISEHVYLHPVYLSKVYKLETGEGLSDYINRIRMEKACHLLKCSRQKIYEIAAALGYQNNYFIRVFKRQYGITPQEYRRIQT
ncbi:response regulator [Cohnella sp. REN36]|uniref:response regulator n=1 Tax=Cohnella sp. REN36 TaxID=2887347 RepID=UPI001D1409E3|nr:response regulator [Cohnella sp. REN36]MCC3372075.1 response regulator [Cohnella sp. REN36]